MYLCNIHTHVTVEHIVKSKDNCVELVLSFILCVNSRDWIWVTRAYIADEFTFWAILFDFHF